MKVKKGMSRWKIRFFKLIRHKEIFTLPSKMSKHEEWVVKIWLELLKDPGSKFDHNAEPEECYIESADSAFYLFLEDHNMKVINTVDGYDIPLQTKTFFFLKDRFRNQLKKRRLEFKTAAWAKVEHSLEKSYNRILQTKN